MKVLYLSAKEQKKLERMKKIEKILPYIYLATIIGLVAGVASIGGGVYIIKNSFIKPISAVLPEWELLGNELKELIFNEIRRIAIGGIIVGMSLMIFIGIREQMKLYKIIKLLNSKLDKPSKK